jgi:hypothetical protein
MLKLSFRTTNAAFRDEHNPDDPILHSAVADVLREVADDIDEGKLSGPIYDLNGNRVGQWSL